MSEDLLEYAEILDTFEEVIEFAKCNKCQKMVPLKDFSKRKTTSFGRFHTCIKCRAKAMKKDHIKNRTKNLNRMKSYNLSVVEMRRNIKSQQAIIESAKKVIEFYHARLLKVHNENQHYDYMLLGEQWLKENGVKK